MGFLGPKRGLVEPRGATGYRRILLVLALAVSATTTAARCELDETAMPSHGESRYKYLYSYIYLPYYPFTDKFVFFSHLFIADYADISTHISPIYLVTDYVVFFLLFIVDYVAHLLFDTDNISRSSSLR